MHDVTGHRGYAIRNGGDAINSGAHFLNRAGLSRVKLSALRNNATSDITVRIIKFNFSSCASSP